jgi:hypothetical protein
MHLLGFSEALQTQFSVVTMSKNVRPLALTVIGTGSAPTGRAAMKLRLARLAAASVLTVEVLPDGAACPAASRSRPTMNWSTGSSVLPSVLRQRPSALYRTSVKVTTSKPDAVTFKVRLNPHCRP